MAARWGGAGEALAYRGLLAALRDDIRSGHFPAGARLKVADLTRRRAMGAMPIRQTLVELQSQGLVSIPANRGASVRILDERLANNLCGLRKAILGLVFRAFVERAAPAELDRLEQLEDALDRTWPLNHPAFRYFGTRDRGAISRNHCATIEAARNRDADLAVALAQQAVEATRHHLLSKLRQEQPG